MWGSNLWLSHRNEMSPLTQGLNYRSACDRVHAVVEVHVRAKFHRAECSGL